MNDSQIQKWKAFVQGNSEFKNLEQLHSYNDTANCRIPIKSDPYHVKQCRERDARHVNRSGAESMPFTNDTDTEPCMGYAEMSLQSFHDILLKFYQILGPSNPAHFLDNGHGTTAHLVISASESGRSLDCAGIEIGVNRFSASFFHLFTEKYCQSIFMEAVKLPITASEIVVVIDEISMVPELLMGWVSLRLRQIMDVALPFGGLISIAMGDFFQIPSVMRPNLAESVLLAAAKEYTVVPGSVSQEAVNIISGTRDQRRTKFFRDCCR